MSSVGLPLLKVDNVSIAYETRKGPVRAVRNISFEVRRGETYGLVGESGCGKSTLANGVMAYLGFNGYADSGRVLFHDQDVFKMTPDQLQQVRGAKISMVYQDPATALNPSIPVGEQLTEVLTIHENISREKARAAALDMLTRVRMADPQTVLDRYPHQLSGGQQQRVVIAMALLANPDLLIMDEPTTGLDVTVEATVLDLIADLRRDFGSAILYISHNLGVIARICDRVGVMYAGELVEEADVKSLFLDSLHPYTVGLLSCVPRLEGGAAKGQLVAIPGQVPQMTNLPPGCIFEPRCSFATPQCRAERPGLVAAMPGHAVRCFNWSQVAAAHRVQQQPKPTTDGRGNGRPASQDERLLTVDRLKSYYPVSDNSLLGWLKRVRRYVRAVDSVDLRVGKGKVLGIVGESGCGKSTLAKNIAGLIAPTDGKLEMLGFDITKVVEKRDRKLLRDLQMIFQNPDQTLNPSHSVGFAISRPLRLFGIVPRRQIGAEIRRLMRAVKLDENLIDRRPEFLSGGQKQRAAIARAFAGKPNLVLCDEPVSSLDVSVQAAILNLLLEFQQQHGTSLVFISHDLSVVRYISDYIAVMYLGQVAEVGRSEDVFNPPYHPYTEALLSAVPVPDPTAKHARIRLEGNLPSPINPPNGCRFNTRCPRKLGEICETAVPPVRDAGNGHQIFCHIPLQQLSAPITQR
ncbi:MAG: ABC transporter ATP-binding protein [Chloroflexi bacterium]|nr:ABC transporter ATP-binding protein [Chloroflexota bacterium]